MVLEQIDQATISNRWYQSKKAASDEEAALVYYNRQDVLVLYKTLRKGAIFRFDRDVINSLGKIEDVKIKR